jgi:hypothetical protein
MCMCPPLVRLRPRGAAQFFFLNGQQLLAVGIRAPARGRAAEEGPKPEVVANGLGLGLGDLRL